MLRWARNWREAVNEDSTFAEAADHRAADRATTLADSLGGRIDSVDGKVDRFGAELDQKLSKQFHVLAGMLVAFFVAVVGGLSGAFFALK